MKCRCIVFSLSGQEFGLSMLVFTAIYTCAHAEMCMCTVTICFLTVY